MRDRTTLLILGTIALFSCVGLVAGLALVVAAGSSDEAAGSIASLGVHEKEDYIVLVAAAYAQDGDLEKAQESLDQLGAPNAAHWVAEVADKYIQEGGDPQDIQNLVLLAEALGVISPSMVAYLPTYTPVPTMTPSPTLIPTNTPVPTSTPMPSPTATDLPTATPTEQPPTATLTATPPPPTETATEIPVTNTPKPPTNTPKPTKPPKPTNTPSPPPVAWNWSERLVGPGEDGQACSHGLLQIRVTVLDAGGNQIPGVWIHDRYSQIYQVTGNVDSADWGPGETKFEYGGFGGGSLCIASSQGGGCETDYSRDMPCYEPPPFEDMWASGYCQCCGSDAGADKEICRSMYEAGDRCVNWGHYAWRIVYQRSW